MEMGASAADGGLETYVDELGAPYGLSRGDLRQIARLPPSVCELSLRLKGSPRDALLNRLAAHLRQGGWHTHIERRVDDTGPCVHLRLTR